MLNIILSIAALIVSLMAIIIQVMFYAKSTKRLQGAVNVIGSYLEMCIKDADVKLSRNRNGDVVGVSITIHPQTANMLITGKQAGIKVE